MDSRPFVLVLVVVFNYAARDGGLEKVGPDDPAQRIRFPKHWRRSDSEKRGLVSSAGGKCLVSKGVGFLRDRFAIAPLHTLQSLVVGL